MKTLTLRQKIAYMLMPSFRYWHYSTSEDIVDGQVSLSMLEDCVRRNLFGGLILFEANVPDRQSASDLVHRLQKANAEGGAEEQLLIAIDQEGGRVSRLPFGTPVPFCRDIADTGDIENARQAGHIIAADLSTVGINLDFAPVMDVDSNPDNPVIGQRSYSCNPLTVASFGRAFIEGLHEGGVLASLKHFPGHGDTTVDSHIGLPLVDKSLQELLGCEIIPFKRNLEIADTIMTAHIQFPQIEKQTVVSRLTGKHITLPATLSKTILTDLLRDRLGYRGVIITDDLCMGAIAKHFAVLDSAKLAINAGADILLMPVDLATAAGVESAEKLIDGLVYCVEKGNIDEKRVDEAVMRIHTLKGRLPDRRNR